MTTSAMMILADMMSSAMTLVVVMGGNRGLGLGQYSPGHGTNEFSAGGGHGAASLGNAMIPTR